MTDESLQATDMGAPFADNIAISLANLPVVSLVRASNALITDLKNIRLGADVSPVHRHRASGGASARAARGKVRAAGTSSAWSG